MPTIIDLENHDRDPLDLIKIHNDIVQHLRSNKIDGMEIRKILDDWQGVKFKMPIAMTRQDIKERRQFDYAIRHASSLLKSEVTTSTEKIYLEEMIERLYNERIPSAVMINFHPSEEGNAKSFKQMIGRQVATLNKYIQPFNKLYLKKDIFSLIAELLEVAHGFKYTQNEIANFDKNNC